MERIKNKVGRPKLRINKQLLEEELKKYFNKQQTAIQTYTNLKVGKTSFYKIIKKIKSR